MLHPYYSVCGGGLFDAPIAPKSSIHLTVRYIKKRDGFVGCYRGLTPKLSANIVSGLVFQRVTEVITVEVSSMLVISNLLQYNGLLSTQSMVEKHVHFSNQVASL